MVSGYSIRQRQGRSEYVQECPDMDTRLPRWLGKDERVQKRIDNDRRASKSHNESAREQERHGNAGWEQEKANERAPRRTDRYGQALQGRDTVRDMVRDGRMQHWCQTPALTDQDRMLTVRVGLAILQLSLEEPIEYREPSTIELCSTACWRELQSEKALWGW